jgi:hypothetical protein
MTLDFSLMQILFAVFTCIALEKERRVSVFLQLPVFRYRICPEEVFAHETIAFEGTTLATDGLDKGNKENKVPTNKIYLKELILMTAT